MRTVRTLLGRKPAQVWTISPNTSVTKAMQLMVEKNVGSLVVLEAAQVVGIVSERDFVRKLLVEARPLPEVTVAEVMSTKVLYVHPDTTIEDCMALITDKRVRHLPVLDDDKLVGVISIGDLVKAEIDDREFMIEQLTNYITDRR
jgi:CBS domain-containing protein